MRTLCVCIKLNITHIPEKALACRETRILARPAVNPLGMLCLKLSCELTAAHPRSFPQRARNACYKQDRKRNRPRLTMQLYGNAFPRESLQRNCQGLAMRHSLNTFYTESLQRNRPRLTMQLYGNAFPRESLQRNCHELAMRHSLNAFSKQDRKRNRPRLTIQPYGNAFS